MTEPDPTPPPPTPETDFPDTWDDAPERPGDGPEPLSPSDPAPAIPSQPPLLKTPAHERTPMLSFVLPETPNSPDPNEDPRIPPEDPTTPPVEEPGRPGVPIEEPPPPARGPESEPA